MRGSRSELVSIGSRTALSCLRRSPRRSRRRRRNRQVEAMGVNNVPILFHMPDTGQGPSDCQVSWRVYLVIAMETYRRPCDSKNTYFAPGSWRQDTYDTTIMPIVPFALLLSRSSRGGLSNGTEKQRQKTKTKTSAPGLRNLPIWTSFSFYLD